MMNGSIERLYEVHRCEFPPLTQPRFTFIDLFAGIGGFPPCVTENWGDMCLLK